MKRWTPLLLAVLLSATVHGQDVAQVNALPSSATERSIDVQMGTRDLIERLWNTTITIEAVDTPLDDFITVLAEKSGCPFHIDNRSLERVGKNCDIPITIRLENVTLGSVLQVFTRGIDLEYVIQPERILICSSDAVLGQDHLVTRYYPVGKWLGDENDDRRLAMILAAVQLLDPEQWEILGGPGSCEIAQGGLVVTQPVRFHDRIERLLKAIVAAKDLPSEAYPTQSISIHPLAKEAKAIEQQLRTERFTKLDTKLSLEELASVLSKQLGIQVCIDNRALEDMGLSSDLIVPTQWKNATIETVLNDLSQQYLVWQIRGDYLCITTPDELERSLEIRVYPVRDLTYGDSQVDVGELPKFIRFDGFFCGSRLPGSPNYPGQLVLKTPADRLLAMFTNEIVPDSWEELGGPGSSVSNPLADCLVVSQERRVHEQIETLLADLRRSAVTSLADEYQEAASEVIDVAYAAPLGLGGQTLLDKDDLKELATLIEMKFLSGEEIDPTFYATSVGDRLIVRQRRDVQRAIYRYLADLGYHFRDGQQNGGH